MRNRTRLMIFSGPVDDGSRQPMDCPRLALKEGYKPFYQIQPGFCKDGHQYEEEDEYDHQFGFSNFRIFSFGEEKKNAAGKQYHKMHEGKKFQKEFHEALLLSPIWGYPLEKTNGCQGK